MTAAERRPEPPREPDDAALVGRCLDGDEAAWRTLIARHGPVVWAAARRVGLRDADAADVYQTVWRIAVQDLTRLRSEGRVRAWLARTARLQALRVVRGYCIARRHLPQVPVATADMRRPEDALLALEDRVQVAAALATIGARCRELLQLLYYSDPRPSYADVAVRIGMPVGSIGPTRARCLEQLERHLGKDSHVASD